jgi:hypothetical protein
LKLNLGSLMLKIIIIECFYPIIFKDAFTVGLTWRLSINSTKDKIPSLKSYVDWDNHFPIFTFL